MLGQLPGQRFGELRLRQKSWAVQILEPLDRMLPAAGLIQSLDVGLHLLGAVFSGGGGVKLLRGHIPIACQGGLGGGNQLQLPELDGGEVSYGMGRIDALPLHVIFARSIALAVQVLAAAFEQGGV